MLQDILLDNASMYGTSIYNYNNIFTMCILVYIIMCIYMSLFVYSEVHNRLEFYLHLNSWMTTEMLTCKYPLNCFKCCYDDPPDTGCDDNLCDSKPRQLVIGCSELIVKHENKIKIRYSKLSLK